MFQKGLKGIIAAETSLSFIDGEKGVLLYRGIEAKELALNYSFEAIAYYLWRGRLPSKQEEDVLRKQIQRERFLPEYAIRLIESLPPTMGIMEATRTVLSSLGTQDYDWKPSMEQAIKMVSIVPTVIAYRYRQSIGQPFIHPNESLGHVENFLFMLYGENPSPANLKALESYMILTMEHGMNASTFTARVIASTESDMVSAVVGALGAMKGPLHGGAPTGIIKMLDEIKVKNFAEDWIRERLENKEKIMGFGHRIYRARDPRAIALQKVVTSVQSDNHWLDLASHVEKTAITLLEEYKPGRRLYTNVEFYAAAVMKSIQMHPDLFTPTFSASRMVGWTAHVLEQAEDNTIFRPEARYKGPLLTKRNH
ncbi:citrate synthase/methylcitrate synthase [Peribacillus alkalitolerans]|uniref:citrate synthase/methylcitrate synthase n=1 Tax=Peribacillus alkalitolerans TaxID=1550385 RepID=UPI0013D5600A|nr:citrate synthase/methylcitrate synthase [Peribacillus alkalitolerans]